MPKSFVFCFFVFVLLSCENRALPPQEKSDPSSVPTVRVEREKGEKEDPLPPEVRIKLRGDEKGRYTWELSGSDVDQILKVNDKLRKQLGGNSTR